jgi:hypothetical protein
MKKQNVRVLMVVAMAIMILQPLTQTSTAYTQLSLTVSAPSVVVINNYVTIKATTNVKSQIMITVDGSLVASDYDTKSLTYSFKSTQINLHTILVRAYYEYNGLLQRASQTKYTIVRWQPPSNSMDWGSDEARDPNSLDLVRLAIKVLDYGNRMPGISGTRTDKGSAIKAIQAFSTNILNDLWFSDDDALKDTEVLESFMDFQSSMNSYNPWLYGERFHFDCRDMAAFVSGLARSIGLGSRMLSIEVSTIKDAFIQSIVESHMVTLVYGISKTYSMNGETRNNGGWYLIDAAYDLYGDSSLEAIRPIYTASAAAQITYDTTFDFVWGFTPGGWGDGVEEPSQQTSWLSCTYAPNRIEYDPNPFFIEVS